MPAVTKTPPGLKSVLRLLAALPPSSGFEPYSLTAFAPHPCVWSREVQRSFRFELDGCCSHVTLHGAARTRWRRDIASALVRAGYEPWLSGKTSADYRRWLRGRSQRVAELRFLGGLDANGAAARWPLRATTSRPREAKQGQWSRERWASVIDDVRLNGDWEDIGIGLSRRATFEAPTRSGRLRLAVSVLSWFDSNRGQRLVAFASASDAADVAGHSAPLPSHVVRRLRRVLRVAGFMPDRARSVVTGKVIAGGVGFEKTVASADGAARECTHTFEQLARAAASLQ